MRWGPITLLHQEQCRPLSQQPCTATAVLARYSAWGGRDTGVDASSSSSSSSSIGSGGVVDSASGLDISRLELLGWSMRSSSESDDEQTVMQLTHCWTPAAQAHQHQVGQRNLSDDSGAGKADVLH